MRENSIEWVNGQQTATLSLSQGKYINKVKKLAQTHEDVKILAENSDGTICAHIPLKYIKLSAPRQMSEEQKEQARERFMMHRK